MRLPLTGMLTFDDFTSDDIDSSSMEEWDVDDLLEDDYDGLDCIITDDTLCLNHEEDELSFIEEVYKGEDFDGLHEEGIAIALAMAEDIGLERKGNMLAVGAKAKVPNQIEINRDCFPRINESKLRPFERYVKQQLYGD